MVEWIKLYSMDIKVKILIPNSYVLNLNNMKKLINLSLIVVLLLLYSCKPIRNRQYKGVNLEQNKIELIYNSESPYNTKMFYDKGDTVFVDSTNTINNIDSNTMQYLIIKPLN